MTARRQPEIRYLDIWEEPTDPYTTTTERTLPKYPLTYTGIQRNARHRMYISPFERVILTLKDMKAPPKGDDRPSLHTRRIGCPTTVPKIG